MRTKGKRNNGESPSDVVSPKRAKMSTCTYGWREMNADLEVRKFLGNYGGQNGVYQAVAELQAGKDLNEHHCLRHDDEHLVPELVELLQNPRVQENWDDVISFNPNGMWARRPTIAGTYARMDICDLTLVVDGIIVNDDKSINVIKMALEPVWNIPRIAERLHLEEDILRESLKRYTQIPNMNDKSFNTFLPPIGGATVYFFGDPRKLADPNTEVAVRCHDECNGSDVFCTDICTCRPYLLFAIQGAVECAQRGGVGVIAYFRKEGRALGEVTKFRVYNARKNQEGGDRPEMYFKQTENIAGIRDARVQELMPDVLVWLGIRRIDWLLSMSSDKYNAITSSGIEVLQRVSLPDEYIPRDAHVELSAKVSAGYHLETINRVSLQQQLSKLEAIRERCSAVYELVAEGKSRFFELHEENLGKAVDAVVQCYNEAYGHPSKIPYHSRARHFELPDGTDLLQRVHASWKVDSKERTRRLLDLTVVSVLTDAGAGAKWTYMDSTRHVFSRSEGLAVASYEMFLNGMFSSDHAVPHRVNSLGLSKLNQDDLKRAYQLTDENVMIGVDGRLKKLLDLGLALDTHSDYFGEECPRPGNMLDFLLARAVLDPQDNKLSLSVQVLWEVIIVGMQQCWPAKKILGLSNGDIGHCSSLKVPGDAGSDLVPFHKLPQWLVYSVIEVLERFANMKFTDLELLTGLAEYRNGGLFVDAGVIKLKRDEMSKMVYAVGSEVVVQWRALTIILIDKVAADLRQRLKVTAQEMPLAKVLQAGTWTAGRKLAFAKRPDGSPPIQTLLDGTVF
eukprot:c4363_g1_i1.p1 GENE.c4363_g1_i1~~c4363_g1_i1.p1  ORF type:complete len:792 (+),score=241.82 c4363_g1_i1:113-2488(+)